VDRLQLASQGTDNGLWDWDLITNRIHYSSGWTSLLGWGGTDFGNTAEEWFSRIHPEDSASVRREINAQIAQGSAQFEIPHRMLHQDGCYRWMVCRGVITRDNTGQATRITGFHLDKTNEKVVDALTGLPNRLLLLERLARSIDKANRRDDFAFAVLVVDLDLFASGINRLDTINTDSLIITTARRLETSLSGRDIPMREGRAHLIARSGGEEFIVLLDGLTETSEAKRIAENLLKEILAPVELNGKEVFLTPSIGIALSATRYRHAEEALRDADTALYRAKSFGKSRCEVFDTAVLEQTRSRNHLEQEIQRALNQNEFIVCYQPVVSLLTQQIAGFEALVRWNHPTRGMVPPMDFIPTAEKTGLIIPLDRHVLRQACSQLKVWKEDARISKDLWVSVNLSSVQFLQPSLAKDIQGILLETGLDANSLMLELTESAVMENPEAARNLLMQLHLLGARIALDDFGTGYSSLAYLRRFPLDYLKIDHSFIRSIENSKDALEITRAITLLSRQLGLRVIAEGIENPSQLEVVRSLECDYGQGFLFAKAVKSREAEKLLLKGFSSGEEIQSPATSLVPASPESDPAVSADTGMKQRFMPSRKLLLTGLPVCILLIFWSLVTRFNHLDPRQSQTPLPPANAVVPEPANPDVLSVPAESSPQKNGPSENSAATRAQSLPGMTVSAREKAAAPAAVVYSASVIHDHVLGSCEGILKFTHSEISFTSSKDKDSFFFAPSQCSYALDGDRLTIKAGPRVFRFKSAKAQNKDDNRSQLSNIYQNISKFYSSK
jgi:diguanylate cyclase (GGDEF)-like protein